MERDAAAEAARRAVAAVFTVNGFAFANWAARLPAVRSDLHLSPAGIGLILLAISVGSVSMLPMAGGVVGRFGPARTVRFVAPVGMAGFAAAGAATALPHLAPEAAAIAVVAVGLAVFGACFGTWDVAMNVEGAQVERRLDRVIMPRFHAGFSLGTVAGAGVGSVAAAAGVPVAIHLPAIGVCVAVVAIRAAAAFLARTPPSHPAAGPPPADGRPGGRSALLAAWLEPRTVLLGVLVFGMAMAEGSANDWLALALVDGYGASQSLAAVGFGVFVAAMTVARIAGPNVLARYENVRVIRVSAGLVLAGTLLVIGGALHAGGSGSLIDVGLAGLGAVAWGCGAALGFPMGMTAAASDPHRAAARVGVVSTIGYVAFLAGPPLLGAIGQRVGVARSLIGVVAAVVLAVLASSSVRTGSGPGAYDTGPIPRVPVQPPVHPPA